MNLKKIINIKKYTDLKIFFFSIFSLKDKNFYEFLKRKKKISKSQIYQDLFVMYFTKGRQNGTFLEIGGGNGLDLSNTYILEKKLNWKGIICEPNRSLLKNIKKNRNAKIETKPVDKYCKKNIYFHENNDPYFSSILKKNSKNNKYLTNSICLNHLLEKNKILKEIDYISIDTEGNEFEIIKNFNFDTFYVKIFTIEHNFNEKIRKKIFILMKNKGYKRVFKHLSHMDDWYINVK